MEMRSPSLSVFPPHELVGRFEIGDFHILCIPLQRDISAAEFVRHPFHHTQDPYVCIFSWILKLRNNKLPSKTVSVNGPAYPTKGESTSSFP